MYVQTSSTPNLMSRFRLGTSIPLSPSAPSGRLQGDLYLQNSTILQTTVIRLCVIQSASNETAVSADPFTQCTTGYVRLPT